MTRLLFTTAFLLGGMAIAWIGSGFIGIDPLALTVTAIIGGVYLIGFIELLQYRQATSTLSKALSAIPESVSILGEWLEKLHPSIQNAVRLRIEGERVGLPGPVLTPYLVGLLVMLGLLGTFVGMVVTLKGAVVALEGTTELQAIRAGLAAPIEGLSLAFGTSVAGVAASAMLGLISTLSRRERMLETRRLDTKIATVFKDFSLTHNRNETYKALQSQAKALPEVAEKLQVMASQLERMSGNVGDNLIASQNQFHESVKSIYSDLATSVDNSLRESLAESGRLTGESIRPIIKEMMAEINKEAQNTHQKISLTAKEQLETLSDRFTNTSREVTQVWQASISEHERSNKVLIDGMSDSFSSFKEEFAHTAASTLKSIDETTSSLIDQQAAADKQRLDLWAESTQQAQEQTATGLNEASKTFVGELQQVTDFQQASFKALTNDFETLSSVLTAEWKQAGEHAVTQQKSVCNALEKTAHDISSNAQSTSTTILSEMNRLVNASDDLLKARVATEEEWLIGHGDRMNNLTETLRNELGVLRDQEELRGKAAVERLADLESTVTDHLTSLGNALEAPMTRLIQTASETPRAAAEVIGRLREEISNNIERDNTLLEERRHLMTELNGLSDSLAQASVGQQKAVEKLVSSSATVLENVGSQFTELMGSEVSKLSEITEHFAGSSIEMSSLGEAFSLAVKLFSESNDNLIQNLTRIESSLENSTSRSDEQLGYYVAQAREIIDHSVMSQKEIFEEIRQLNVKEERSAAEVV